MTRVRTKSLILALVLGCLPTQGIAQSEAPEPSLGDLARALRKQKAAPQHTVIDNENLQKVMDEVQERKLKGSLLFTFDSAASKFQVSSPDVTCDLSFSASATPLISDAYITQDLPASELAKLEGPAAIRGDALQVSVHNGTSWNIKEITVGLTLLRRPEPGSPHVVPAAETTTLLSEKPSDQTVLYHLKGSAPPSSTTIFQQTLASSPALNQDWHWAIVQAKGLPPQKAPAPAGN